MPYPGTIDNWFDHSGIQARETVERYPRPLLIAAAAFDRGPEKITITHGEDFYKTYGYYIDFDKYGQAAIQVANAIDNGADVMLKRVVANDATLANAVVCATVQLEQVQKTNENGEPLYTDNVTMGETTEDGDGQNQAIMINNAKIAYEVMTVADKKTFAEIMDAAADLIDEEGEEGVYTYPLFVITDNGRGESTKRFSIDPQYAVSKNQQFMLYKLNYLGSKDLDAESVYFAMKPGILYTGKSMDLDMACTEMIQCQASGIEESIDAFYKKVSEFSGIDETTLYSCDLVCARSNAGKLVQGLTLDENSLDLSAAMGFDLESGTNGNFGDKPIESDEYNQALVEFFNGTFDEDIYNLDMYKIDACVDANYPFEVKKAIVDLAAFRKDFFFFGDLGLEISTYENAVTKMYEMPKDKFTAWYPQSYQVLNPFTKKKIDVTIGYSLARLVIDHIVNRRHTPFCGILYGWTIPEAIEGSVNFTPKITPKYNQKETLGELRLNYASVLNNVLTLETEYTSQDTYTQLSYINNVTAIQKIIKDVRDKCPASRYSFITGNDLQKYKNDVSNILMKYTEWFDSLEFVYIQDDIMRANKIFEADIKIRHKDFVQQEIFNIYTLGVDVATEASSTTTVQTQSSSGTIYI